MLIPKLLLMDTFRTLIKIAPQKLQITHKDSILFLGSCFAGNIGNRMQSLKFNTLVNPFGVIFNPSSVAESIRLLAECKSFSKEDLFFYNGLWFSFNHHGSFSSPDPDACLDAINSELKAASEILKKCKFLSLTFGTSWIYRHKQNGKVVANCHKLPESNFSRQLLKPDEIVKEYSELIKSLHSQNPGLRLLFTISPVRHLRDGMEGNQLSKSILHLAVNQILKENENCFYFPAYEIVMDDLRDYRFYEEDMVHPNKLAINYIWDQFSQAYFSSETQELNKELEKLVSALNHRPLHPEGMEFNTFRTAQLKFINQLIKKYPELNFEKEENYFSKSI